MSQGPSTNIAKDIDAGNGILYYATTPYTSFASALTGTRWRKFGMMKDQVYIQVAREYLEFYSGVPSSKQAEYVTSEDVMMGGTALEGRPGILAQLLGGMEVVRTTKASSPAPSTVQTGSTKTSIIFADITGYAAHDEIKVGTQYGRIASIDTATDTATLYEGLDGDEDPTPGDVIAKVDTSAITLGTLTAPEYLSLKFSHEMIGGYGSFDFIILKAQIRSNFDVNFQDNTKTPESIGYGFTASAIRDTTIESGNTAYWQWTQS